MRFELRAILRTSHVLDFEREIQITCTVQISHRFTCGGKFKRFGETTSFCCWLVTHLAANFFLKKIWPSLRFDSGKVGVNVAIIS
jgi:hypothetical protein